MDIRLDDAESFAAHKIRFKSVVLNAQLGAGTDVLAIFAGFPIVS